MSSGARRFPWVRALPASFALLVLSCAAERGRGDVAPPAGGAGAPGGDAEVDDGSPSADPTPDPASEPEADPEADPAPDPEGDAPPDPQTETDPEPCADDLDIGDACLTEGLGACMHGRVRCVQAKPVCVALVEPTEETCDGIDNDCDGDVDEGDPGGGEACGGGGVGFCAFGRTRCVEGGQICEPVEPGDEICDGLDNDCDGEADEGDPGTGEPCDTGSPGECAAGVGLCEAGELTCEPSRLPGAVEEICNGLDDDCDGEVDEDEADAPNPTCLGCDDDGAAVGLVIQCGGGGYQPTYHEGACAEGEEVHIVGVYESAERAGPIDVTVSRLAAPLSLVLSSYEPVQWRLDVAEGVRIRRVVLNGYNPHAVEGAPEDAEVIDRSGLGQYLSACAYRWPGDDQGCDTQALVRGVEELLEAPVTSFQGCYNATTAEVDDP